MPKTYPFTLRLQHGDEVREITQLCQKVVWSGSTAQVGRTLDVTMIYAPEDENAPLFAPENGDAVELETADGVLFSGTVLTRQRKTSDVLMTFAAYDWGLYLKENESCAKCQGLTPEEYTRRICTELGLRVGALAETGVQVSRNFLPASYYEQIRTVYALAAEQTGGKYYITLRGRVLSVVDVTKPERMLLLDTESNLTEFAVKENAAGVCNRVSIYDDGGNVVRQLADDDAAALYGVFEKALKASGHDDAEGAAQELLDTPDTTIRAACFGSPMVAAGSAVIVREPITGTFGQFYVKSDAQTWQNELFTASVELTFDAVVDEKTAGEAVKDA